MWVIAKGTGQRTPRRCDPAKHNTLAAVATPIPHHTTHSKPECWSGGRLSGRPGGKAKCTGRHQKAREHLVGHASSTESQSKPAGSGTRLSHREPEQASRLGDRGGLQASLALLCPGKGQPRPLRKLSVGHLPLQCPRVSFLTLPCCSGSPPVTRQCSSTV